MNTKNSAIIYHFTTVEKWFMDEWLRDRSEYPFFVYRSFTKLRLAKQKKIETNSPNNCWKLTHCQQPQVLICTYLRLGSWHTKQQNKNWLKNYFHTVQKNCKELNCYWEKFRAPRNLASRIFVILLEQKQLSDNGKCGCDNTK